MARRGIFRGYGKEEAKEFRSKGWAILRNATLIGGALGLLASISIRFTGGNQINMNGEITTGFWSYAPFLTIACAIAGIVLGLIGWLLLRAMGEAAGGNKG